MKKLFAVFIAAALLAAPTMINAAEEKPAAPKPAPEEDKTPTKELIVTGKLLKTELPGLKDPAKKRINYSLKTEDGVDIKIPSKAVEEATTIKFEDFVNKDVTMTGRVTERGGMMFLKSVTKLVIADKNADPDAPK